MRTMLATAPDTIPILIAPNPLLKAKARPVGRSDDAAIRDLAAKMLAALESAEGFVHWALDHGSDSPATAAALEFMSVPAAIRIPRTVRMLITHRCCRIFFN